MLQIVVLSIIKFNTNLWKLIMTFHESLKEAVPVHIICH